MSLSVFGCQMMKNIFVSWVAPRSILGTAFQTFSFAITPLLGPFCCTGAVLELEPVLLLLKYENPAMMVLY